MTTFEENTHNPTSHEREKKHGDRRAQEASSILLLLILLTLVFAISTTCGAEETNASKTKPYPDKWYQAYPGKERISNICFSDRDIWGDEPVALLLNIDYKTYRGTAVGFFSGKRRKIYAKYSVDPNAIKPNRNIYYAGTKREIKCQYPFQQTNGSKSFKTADGGEIKELEKRTLTLSEIIDELFPEDMRKKWYENVGHKEPAEVEEIVTKKGDYRTRLLSGDIVYGKLNLESSCETATDYLIKKDKGGNIVWAKAFVRYYPDRAKAPGPLDSVRCVGKMRIDSTVHAELLLEDGTILVGAPGAVVRIRQEDGGTRPVPERNFKVFDAVDVMKAKLEIMEKQAALLRKCAEDRVALRMSECHLYSHNTGKPAYRIEVEEAVQLDLARQLFGIE
jgi:hypothetical protein